MDNLWQSPFVNVFKHFNIGQWQKVQKEGDVVSLMEKVVKGTVYRITGSVPAGNFIQMPKVSGQSLGLSGRYFYLLFKPIPSKHFVVHMDVATWDNLVVRISFSNLFKEFKSTSTWLQFPFVCTGQGSLPSYVAEAARDRSGPSPLITRWSVLCLDLQQVLSMYLNRKFLYVKSVKLCANMYVKNVFTSNNLYDPELSMAEAKKQGTMSQGVYPLPRDMSFPVEKGGNWHDSYHWIRFPLEIACKSFDAIEAPNALVKTTKPTSKTDFASGPRRIQPCTVDVSRGITDRVSLIDKVTAPRKSAKHQHVTKELPTVIADLSEQYRNDLHVYSHPSDDVIEKKTNTHSSERKLKVTKDIFPPKEQRPSYSTLEPDPIMKLKQIIGFGGASYRDVLWSSDGTSIVYHCHAVIVSMKVSNGHQRFFIGHTDKVSCLSLSRNSSLLASGQTGQMSTVRVWKYSSGECLAIGRAHVHSLSCLSFSSKGSLLCGVGRDNHGKNLIVVWNTARAAKHREVSIFAKAHTDVDISRILLAPFDETKMLSCGKDNIRFWRVTEGSIRSAPVNLGEYTDMEFTDICFESSSYLDSESENKLFYASTKSGHIFEVDYRRLTVHHVRRLLPSKSKISRPGQPQSIADSQDASLSINSLHLNETFCVTGSDDGYLRLWPLDFAHVYLEAEHQGPVTASRLSPDGLKILAGTNTGNLGVLDVSTRNYVTLMRSHTGKVLSFALDPRRRHLATVSDDHTIRVWDADNLQQLYDFSAAEECPCTIDYHPTKQSFACGFQSGTVRVFNVETTSLVADHRHLRGQVTGLVYSTDGSRLFACCSLGVAAIYDASLPSYPVVRVIAALVARGEKFGPHALSMSPCGRRVAFVGPTEFTVTVSDAKCLDELLRIDISNMGGANPTATSSSQLVTRVAFSPSKPGHLIIATSDNRIMKYEARTGKLVHQSDHIHRTGCSAVAVSDCGQFVATGGDKSIKVWDYMMNLDINFQVFIGHSENVSHIYFTPDGLSLISTGEAVYMWDFLAQRSPTPPVEGRSAVPEEVDRLKKQHGFPFLKPKSSENTTPRSDDIDGLSSIHEESDTENDLINKRASDPIPADHCEMPPQHSNGLGKLSGSTSIHSDQDDASTIMYDLTRKINNTQLSDRNHSNKYDSTMNGRKSLSASKSKDGASGDDRSDPGEPTVFSHYKHRDKSHCIAQRRYTATPQQAGLKLKYVIGFNNNGRNNMVWNPDTGFFAYTTGCIIVIDDLTSGTQKYLEGHNEEISTLALQYDSLILASASPAFKTSPCHVCIWDMQTFSCKKVLNYHQFGVQCMSFSRDDRFLITVGDYRACEVAVWDTLTYDLLASSMAAYPIHSVQWDPFTVNEFICVGDHGTVLFWLLDETSSDVSLNMHLAELPEELDGKRKKKETPKLSFTSVAYARNSVVYIGSHTGNISAWDTHNNSCFLHWEADHAEITVLVSRHNRLMSGSTLGSVKVWSLAHSDSETQTNSGLTMEDEIKLDGPIVCAAFDDTLDMGIVGTSSGILWYINWPERSSVRLVSGHKNKINGVAFTPSGLLVTGADDGSVRVWSLANKEQMLQFQVMEQSCTSIASQRLPGDQISTTALPLVAGGYSDGTIRVFDLKAVSMLLKMQPHPVKVTALEFSADDQMIISGGSDGLIAISSPSTGMTVRVIHDHKGTSISAIDVTLSHTKVDVGVTAPTLWLACSMDRRVSVWSADWSKDFCELVDWLTFAGPAVLPDGSRINKNDTSHYQQLPPTLARFSPNEPDTIIYTGYGMEKCIQFYSLQHRKVTRTIRLTHWGLCLDISPDSTLISIGIPDHLFKLMDYTEGSFQDYTGHSDAVSAVKFSPAGSSLLTISHNEFFLWDVML